VRPPVVFSRRTGLKAAVALGSTEWASTAHAGPKWRSLWNGVDLAGWSTWVGIPHRSRTGLDLPKTPDGNYAEPLGENKDPRGVYSVVKVDGRNALRISGELFGALTTEASFSNYHLYIKWRWGTAQWEPRATGARDSGVLIHATGAHGQSGPSHNWMRSIECQIQENDCGDLWSVGGVRMKAPCRTVEADDKPALRFDPRGLMTDVPTGDPSREARVRRGVNSEHPTGKWNVTEIVARRDTGEFKVNGQTVMRYTNARVDVNGTSTPLDAGRIQLQSEGAEIFFAEVRLRPL